MTSQGDAHPDEGTIHAWLDRQLDATSSATLEAHLQRCDECAERVAEARGLIAGTSRILASLDDETAGATPLLKGVPVTPEAAVASVPPAPAPAGGGVAPAWRRLRVTPARAAIAATLLVAIGVTLTHGRTGPDTVAVRPSTPMAAAPPAGAPRDHLLDSAVARNIAKAIPPRTVEPAAAPPTAVALAEPSPPTPSPASIQRTDSTAARRVAVGRAAARAERETTVGADLARVADARSEAAFASTGRTVASAECYRIESASGTAATWGSVELPLVVALEGTAERGGARVLTPAGVETGTRAGWHRAGDDSLIFALRQLGYQGSLMLGAAGEARAGVMRSRQATSNLSAVVVTSAAGADEARARTGQQSQSKAAPPTTPATPATSATPLPEDQIGAASAPAVPVVGRRVSCPAR